ncbi:MAG: aminoacyl-tRNA hydrolase, partial [Cystobacter sp.]
FMVVEALLSRARAQLNQEKFQAKVGQGSLGSERILFVEPQTYMNLSGRSAAEAARFYKIAVQDVLVIHDELDLPFGRLQLKAGGGSGGHNGLRSTVSSLGEDGFIRLRFGIGKPPGPNAKERVAGYVLSHFDDGEQRRLDELLALAADAAETWARDGLATAMNRYNKRSP